MVASDSPVYSWNASPPDSIHSRHVYNICWSRRVQRQSFLLAAQIWTEGSAQIPVWCKFASVEKWILEVNEIKGKEFHKILFVCLTKTE